MAEHININENNTTNDILEQLLKIKKNAKEQTEIELENAKADLNRCRKRLAIAENKYEQVKTELQIDEKRVEKAERDIQIQKMLQNAFAKKPKSLIECLDLQRENDKIDDSVKTLMESLKGMKKTKRIEGNFVPNPVGWFFNQPSLILPSCSSSTKNKASVVVHEVEDEVNIPSTSKGIQVKPKMICKKGDKKGIKGRPITRST